MDKKIAGLLGAAAALTTMTGAAQAAPAQSTEASAVRSYRDLLDPIPNAGPLLKADDARLAQQRPNEATRLAQVSIQLGHHHHHHHGRVNRHHHHHHHSYHHHHHHHHHH
jgi:hypothetical protein